MSSRDLAISVRNLGKVYRITHQAERATTAGEAVARWLRKPLSRSAIQNFRALDDISFDVYKGDVLGIIGRNGAGKSTLLKVLSRITEPSSGRVELYGRVGSLLEVGTGFHQELTGRENIFLNGGILGMSRSEIRREFDNIVEFSGVEKFLDTPVKRYSSGMYVRLAFAVAANLRSEILIVDEVLAVGDAEFQKKCIGKMQDVATTEGRTVLFVSHNLGAVRSLCTRALSLASGRIHMAGGVHEVTTEYLEASLRASTNIIDLGGTRRTGEYGHSLKVQRIAFNRGGPLVHGERLTVRIDYEAYAAVSGCSFGFGISTLDGVRLISFDSDLAAERRDVEKGECATVECEVDNLHLQPGRYSLDVGARSGDSGSVDYLSACAVVEIIPGVRTPGMIIRGDGGVRYPALWRLSADALSENRHRAVGTHGFM
jgi:lipopolysaccharide transport system ATP-binding protein